MKKTVGVLLVEDGGHWAARSADVLDIYAVGKNRPCPTSVENEPFRAQPHLADGDQNER